MGRKRKKRGMVSGNLMNLEFYRRTVIAARESQFMSLNRSMRAASKVWECLWVAFAPTIKSIMWTALSGEVVCDFSRGRHSEKIEVVWLSNGAFHHFGVDLSARVSCHRRCAQARRSSHHQSSVGRPGFWIITYDVVSHTLKREGEWNSREPKCVWGSSFPVLHFDWNVFHIDIITIFGFLIGKATFYESPKSEEMRELAK
jgi:hypothetical protein